MRQTLLWVLAMMAVVTLIAGCTVYTTRPGNTPGRPSVYVDPGTVGPAPGLGVESQDIVSMTDRMMRDMLANRTLAGRTKAPRVIMDSVYFTNRSSTRFDKNLIVDRLRVALNQASRGRMVFLARHHANMVEKERELKREGVVDPGSNPKTAAPLGGDYRLGGSIKSLDKVLPSTGVKSRYHQITFEMVDLETSAIVWGGTYEFKKAGKEDAVYR